MTQYVIYREGFVKKNGEIIDEKRVSFPMPHSLAYSKLCYMNDKHFIQEVRKVNGEWVKTEKEPIYLGHVEREIYKPNKI